MTYTTLRDVLWLRNEIVHPRDNPSGAATFVGLEHIEPHTGRRLGSSSIRLEVITGRKARFHEGDIVYGYLRPYLNKVWVAEFDGYCSVDQYVFRTKHGYDTRFVAAFLRSPAFLERAPIDETPGQLPRIRIEEILSVEFPSPPLDDQLRIASVIDQRDRLVGRLSALAVEQRRLTEALGSRSYHAAFPIDPLAASKCVPELWGWQCVRLSDHARLESGHTPSRRRPEWWGGDVPWIQLADIRASDGRVIHDTAETTNAQGIANSAARILPPATVVMSRTASVGFVAMMGRPMATSQDFVNWVCGPGLDPEFLMHLLIRSRDYIRSLSAGAIHKTVYYPTVKDFHVCMPPIEEQRRIVSELKERQKSIDAMTRANERQREAIAALPAALLGSAFAELEAA